MSTLPDATDGRPVAVLYAAKSTQDVRGSISTQLADGRALCEREGVEVDGEHVDPAHSAFTGNRGPGLEAARARAAALAAERGSCLLVAQHSDRFARGGGNAPGAAQHLSEVLFWAMRSNVVLRTVQDDANVTSPLLAAVIGERNYEDSRRKSLATRDGKRRAAERGQRNGGPRPFGYAQGDGSLTLIQDEAAVVRRLGAEVVAGRSQAKIAVDLNRDGVATVRGRPWSQTRVAQTIRNPLYAGKVLHRGDVLDGAHEAVFSPEEWGEIQAALAARRRGRSGRGRDPQRHLFARGMLRCGARGSAMAPRRTTNSQGRVYEMYACGGKLSGSSPDCPQPTAQRRSVDDAVLAYFNNVGLDVEATRRRFEEQVAGAVAETTELLRAAERQLARARERLDRVRRDYHDGGLSIAEWQDHREQLEGERGAAIAQVERLVRRRRELEAEGEGVDAEAELLRYLAALRAAVSGHVRDAGALEAVRAALRRLFDGFSIHSCDVPEPEEPPTLPEGWIRSRRYLQPELMIVGGWVVEPHPRPQAILDLDKTIDFPQLRRMPLEPRAPGGGSGR